jgi:hypothetical protein
MPQERQRNIALLVRLNFWLPDGKREIVTAFMMVISVAVKLYNTSYREGNIVVLLKNLLSCSLEPGHCMAC